MRHIIVGTAGHIDHGKTSLVRVLTGVETDRFKEEKERGITIDIGFANLNLEDETQFGFVDVPGHERFVKNMLAGIGGIDLVVLIVAADESVMPQTREHMEICSLLRIQHGFTILTKIDSVDSDLIDLAEMEVRDYLKGTFLGDAPIVRFSAVTEEGKGEVIETLKTVSAHLRARDSGEVFRLPIDRCFTMKGFGTVVTGTLVSGSVGKDALVQLLPSGQEARIRGVQVHGRSEEQARAGQRTALNLQGIDVRHVERGMVLTTPGLLRPTSVIDCHLELLPSASKAVTRRKRVRFHVGTAEIMGYVQLLGQDRLEPGGSAFAQIRLENNTVTVPGDRFIIRQYSPMITIGGGKVLEVKSKRHRLKDKRVLHRLEVLHTSNAVERLMVIIGEGSLKPVELNDLVSQVGLAPKTIRNQLEELRDAGKIRFLSANPLTVIADEPYQTAMMTALSVVEDFHKNNPLAPGISREALQSRAFGHVTPIVFQSILNDLVQVKKLDTSSEIVHLYGHRVTLNSKEQEIRDTIQAEFRNYGLEVPQVDEVVAKLGVDLETAKTILRFMIRDGALAKINEQFVVDQGVMDGVITKLKELKKIDSNLGVAEFKKLTNVSRKYAIPILEYLDRIRVTRRNGNSRLIL